MDPKVNEQPTTPERAGDSVLISEIPVIEQGGIRVTNKQDLAALVEAPLLEACEDLYDKNIRTVMSSANKKDVDYGGQAYIDIDFESLSEENKEIGLKWGELFDMHGFRPMKCLKINFPVNENTTVGDVRKMAREAVSNFKPQEITKKIEL